jgi:ATP-dependent Lhr-like helicase
MPDAAPIETAGLVAGPVADWFHRRFPSGPTPAQAAAWPAFAAGENLLVVSPTGTGKTLAAFLAILARLWHEHERGVLGPGLRCVYISPLRSLGYDIERNLSGPLEEIRVAERLEHSPIRLAVRTGDTPPLERRRMLEEPPHLLITTPESLALLLSQPKWLATWAGVESVIVDEVHALMPTKRGADLAVSLERLAAHAFKDAVRIGLSATCRPVEPVVHWLVGPGRTCRVVQPEVGLAERRLELGIEWIGGSEDSLRPWSAYRQLVWRLVDAVHEHQTTLVFANTRAFAERITHDLRRVSGLDPETIAAHHSALDAMRRRAVEASLKAGAARAVVSSTSLELGIDIGCVDFVVQLGLPGGVARLLQRVGRSGHQVDGVSKGLILAGTAAEVVGAAVAAIEAKAGRIEPLEAPASPLDVLCQQLIGMACVHDWIEDEALALLRRAGPFERLARDDFDACLDFLAGALPTAAGAFEPEPGAGPRWSAPRLWRAGGRFGLQSSRVERWLWRNIGTITSEEAVHVLAQGIAVGTIEAPYAEGLQRGDRFVLDGRALEFGRLEGFVLHVRATPSDPGLPRWTSERLGLSADLARAIAQFRADAADVLFAEGSEALDAWLRERSGLDRATGQVIEDLIEAQERVSEVPRENLLLIEEWHDPDGFSYAFHAPLGRPACEPIARAIAARLGDQFGRDLGLAVADLGWSMRLSAPRRLLVDQLPALLHTEGFHEAVLMGLERSELLARRFRHVATTALMVLRNPDGGRRRVGGMFWVSERLYPLLKRECPDHPLLRETRREVLDDLLDTSTALEWLATRPRIRMRRLDAPSPFTAAWIDPAQGEHVVFERPGESLKRLHARLMASGCLAGLGPARARGGPGQRGCAGRVDGLNTAV